MRPRLTGGLARGVCVCSVAIRADAIFERREYTAEYSFGADANSAARPMACLALVESCGNRNEAACSDLGVLALCIGIVAQNIGGWAKSHGRAISESGPWASNDGFE